MTEAKLLSAPTNWAVVQLPERKFPGVVIQGDSLNNLIQVMRHVERGDADQADQIAEVLDILTGAQNHYEAICSEAGITLPYPKN